MFAKEKHITMNDKLITIEVSGIRDAQNSFGALVDLNFNKLDICTSASRLVWFPKSICILKKVEYELDYFGKAIVRNKYFMSAPKWFLDKNNITYNPDQS
tara:strand:- start:495 stop:794 length:300 start_codon:yes stop_codon:yes gene_type:complete